MATLLKVLNNLADIKSAGVLHFASELRLERSCGVFLNVERASFLRRGFAFDGGLNGDGVSPDQLDDHVGDVGVQAIRDISALTSQVKRVTS
jgi:hypothetical protein